ncbi:MAG: DUF3078 domain-containing protein [Phaeodactylibacter sp.]|nr:DUF3078 domain-containing protein [Phaeodactylibacter sp.]MCB9288292.1 DUF3078 domain-containing protein [Lewinellaceae bacterium]
MYRSLFTFAILSFIAFSAVAQTEEELKEMKAQKKEEIKALESQIATLNGEVADINKQLLEFPRWETGVFGIVGANLNGFSDWFAREKPNSTAIGLSFSANAYANYFTRKTFWRNAGNLNIGFTRLKEKDRDGNVVEETELKSPDVVNFSSLFGYKLSEKLAISVLGEYRSTFLENFNNPGYLDLGTGITWTPIENLVVVAHPLNYNFVFAEAGSTFESSLGAKIMADYTKEILTGVNWKSNLSYFLSYQDPDYSNWTWVNGIAFQALKKVGVGLELGLRSNKQEAIAKEVADNPLQVYYVAGLTYSL